MYKQLNKICAQESQPAIFVINKTVSCKVLWCFCTNSIICLRRSSVSCSSPRLVPTR